MAPAPPLLGFRVKEHSGPERAEPARRGLSRRASTRPAALGENQGMSDAPKSAFELAMERLRRQDAEAGIQEVPLTDAQRTAIADVRSAYEARVAERRIMHQSATAGVFEPAERAERDLELRRDLERVERERDEKIKRIRAGSAYRTARKG